MTLAREAKCRISDPRTVEPADLVKSENGVCLLISINEII